MKRRRLFATLGVLMALWLLPQTGGCSYFGFGLAERDHPSYFKPASNLNNVLKYNEEYSWLTTIPVGGTRVEVEHGTVATDEDIQKLGLPEGRYLYASLKVQEPTKVLSIKMDYNYDGEPLEVAGTYLYRTHRLPNGQPDPAHPEWDIVPIKEGTLAEQYPYGFIRLFKFPRRAWGTSFLPREWWFHEPLSEHITLETTEDGVASVHELQFKTHWHKHDAMWWIMLHAT